MAFSTRGPPGAICVPMDVDAFILNKPVCDSGLVKIAPITQPDYAGLRTEKSQIRADILSHVDVTNSQPASVNPRISEIEAASNASLDVDQPQSDVSPDPPLRDNRIGVYLHWSLPRMYRAGYMGAEGTQHEVNNANKTASPKMWQVPTRWLVARRILSSEPSVPEDAREDAWIVESDRLWHIDDLGEDVDLETDVSPFVIHEENDERSADALNKQASVFIGAKFPAKGWREVGDAVPRTQLTVMNSSNFCFADNTMHNPNVFSMVDNCKVTDSQGNIIELQRVVCDYVVLGWHSEPLPDPLYPKISLQGPLENRLRDLFLSPGDGLGEARLKSWDDGRTVCHGTVYNVTFDRGVKPPTPIEEYAKFFTPQTNMEPLSVGTTGLDAILSFLKAHEDDPQDVFGNELDSVADHLLTLSELLYATEDDYNSRVKAADLLYARNFSPSSGGTAWQYDGKAGAGQQPAEPNTVEDGDTGTSELGALRTVNELQEHLDASTRLLHDTRWSLFAIWWEFVADPNNEDSTRRTWYAERIREVRDRASGLIKLITTPDTGLSAQVEKIVRKASPNDPTQPALTPARSIPQPSFYQRKDPTLGIAAMPSGWPLQYLGRVPVRSVLSNGNDAETILASEIRDSHIPHALWVLGREALTSREHGNLLGFKTWTGQPWCPLYLEWEAVYFHIPIEKWTVDLVSSPIGHAGPQVRYVVNETLANDPEIIKDQRRVSGRALMVPQAAINLKALVEQVIDTPGVTLTPDERRDLIANVERLAFTTADLSGLTSNLLTMNQGTHVQPNLNIPGEMEDHPLLAAYLAGRDGGIIPQDLATMGDATDMTPYGTLLRDVGGLQNLFKAVTHGQMVFTKLNIIDKFGQVLPAIPPTPQPETPDLNELDKVYPCLGDQVCPNLIPGTANLNTITPLTEADPHLPGDYPLCPYVQLTPAINQPARLNAHFLLPAIDSAVQAWRVADDWDQPVWGWIVINFADYGLQFFTADAQFYVEMTLGGPNSSITSPKFLPFEPPAQGSNLVSPQLDQLVKRLADAVYLRAFFDMISRAVETMPHAPGDYAAYATSIIGKPLALVNVGFSLELATPPFVNMAIPSPPSPLGPAVTPDAAPLLDYKFPAKIGDAERPFDGVVGYFDFSSRNADLDHLHTYFAAASSSPGDPRVQITPSNFATLSPFHINPMDFPTSSAYMAAKTSRLLVKSMIIDPYTPLHVYTPILPVKSLQLPAWTVQRALQKMSAFFHVGPTLLTKNLPTVYDDTKPLTAESWMQAQRERQNEQASAKIRLPIGGAKKGTWEWLQPYRVQSDDGLEEERKYNAFEVGEDDGSMRLDPGPYALIEGFLQYSKPVNT